MSQLNGICSRIPEMLSASMQELRGTGVAAPAVSALAGTLIGEAQSRGYDLSALELRELLTAANKDGVFDGTAAMRRLDTFLKARGL